MNGLGRPGLLNPRIPQIRVLHRRQLVTTLKFTQKNWPTPGEFRRMVQDALAKSNPVDDLLELAGELRGYEQQCSMSSEEFFRRF